MSATADETAKQLEILCVVKDEKPTKTLVFLQNPRWVVGFRPTLPRGNIYDKL